mmetsp:Transcript_27282/g.57151  ORF Transcript_27282/g.57151 Transcript_27282/m.57151 type:complete len:488 (-) Transcript_27282:84-1547(-)
MGCWWSSPYNPRVYAEPSAFRDPGDLDEEVIEPLRYFGTNRVGSNLVPDDIPGLESTHMKAHLAQNSDLLLYEAEIDNGFGWRCCRPFWWCMIIPWLWPLFLAWVAANGMGKACGFMSCDQICCWVRKEYSTRTFFRVYPNRIEVNYPVVRFPFGYFGCGSWNSDVIQTHPFDRGAFGFNRVHCCTLKHCCCICPLFGGVVARHRCQCNGPLWNRMLTDCGGWWCEEWLCKSWFCVYPYQGLAYPDEVAFACSIALQAYFEGRGISPEDMEKCLEFWRENVSEIENPHLRREACCEPAKVPCCQMEGCYRCYHSPRKIPFADSEVSDRTKEAYEKYGKESAEQIARYNKISSTQYNTFCKAMGCRRFFGRKGFIFCTEGCTHCDRKAGEVYPPPEHHEIEDDFDASSVLMKVVGPPPSNVVIKRWRWDPEKNEHIMDMYPKEETVIFEESNKKSSASAPPEESPVVDVETGDVETGDANSSSKIHDA